MMNYWILFLSILGMTWITRRLAGSAGEDASEVPSEALEGPSEAPKGVPLYLLTDPEYLRAQGLNRKQRRALKKTMGATRYRKLDRIRRNEQRPADD